MLAILSHLHYISGRVARPNDGHSRVMANAGGRSGPAYEATKRYVWRTYSHCYHCGEYVDQTLPKNHPMARTVEHIIPLSTARNAAHRRLLLNDRNNVRLAHRSCNSSRSNRPIASNPSRDW